MVYLYPEVYEGYADFKNSIWDRKKDNKLYFKVGPPDCPPGGTVDYYLKMIPFSAEPENWKDVARPLCLQDW